MTYTRPQAKRQKKSLDPWAPSTHDPNRKSRQRFCCTAQRPPDVVGCCSWVVSLSDGLSARYLAEMIESSVPMPGKRRPYEERMVI